MRQVRAKFRCMSVTHDWGGNYTFRFLAVIQHGDNLENEEFWKFTPSGEAKLVFKGPGLDNRGEEYKPGDYYYIDMVKTSEGGWVLSEVTHRSADTGTVDLVTTNRSTVCWGEEGLHSGKLSMSIDNPLAFAAYDFGEDGPNWDVQLIWAEASDA